MNLTPFVFWGFCSLVGYLLTGTLHGTLFGLAIGLGVSIIVDLFT